MSDDKLLAARAYIESGDYQAAKAILETLPDNRTAQRWLSKLAKTPSDETDPQEQPSKNTNEASFQRWEYCLVGSLGHVSNNGDMSIFDPVLVRFSPEGDHQVWSLEHKHPATIIAQLGAKGWEMVGAGSGFTIPSLGGATSTLHHVLYFKRPLKE